MVQLTMVCTACEDTRCGKTFVCESCGRELNACEMRCGGIEGGPHPHDLCADCFEDLALPEGWDAELPKKLRRMRSVAP
jgi:hypothetical protein